MHISYSQYALFSDCPAKWKYRYVDKLKDSSSIESAFGTAMHNTIQSYLTCYYTESQVKWKRFDVLELLKQELMATVQKELLLPLPLTTPEEMSEYYSDGCEILLDFRRDIKQHFPLKGYELIGVEIPLLLEIRPQIEFKGFLDTILRNTSTNRYSIIDYKTSKKGWHFQKKDTKKTDQLVFYKSFYSQQANIPIQDIDTRFIILKRKLYGQSEYEKRITSFEPSSGQISMKKALKRLDVFLDVFDSQWHPKLDVLQPTPTQFGCTYCVGKTICPVSMANG